MGFNLPSAVLSARGEAAKPEIMMTGVCFLGRQYSAAAAEADVANAEQRIKTAKKTLSTRVAILLFICILLSAMILSRRNIMSQFFIPL